MCKQILVVNEDVKSIVLVILNEKPGDVAAETFSIVEISTFMSNGGALGGLNIAPTTNIPAEAQAIFDKHFGGFLGANNKAFALLATQLVHGGAYVFAVESSMVVAPGKMTSGAIKSINLVKVFSDFSEIETINILDGIAEGQLLGTGEEKPETVGYAFPWLSKAWP